MLDAKMIFDIEQSTTMLVEMIKTFHEELKNQFSEEQAWELLKVFMFTICGGKGTTQ